MIRAFRWAIAFLTVLPVAPRGKPREGELARAAAFFPLVGAGVGLACWGVDLASAARLPALLRGLLVVAAGTVLTRALHLDGLADTADGLGSMRDRASMLEVMRDPHVGAFGAAALVIVILIQAVCIAELPAGARAGTIMAAAVADFKPSRAGSEKIRRVEGIPDIELVSTPDVLKGVHETIPRPFLVGFAAETGSVDAAVEKARAKGVDLLVANDVAKVGSGFGTDTNEVTFVFKDGTTRDLELMSKQEVATEIWDTVLGIRAES